MVETSAGPTIRPRGKAEPGHERQMQTLRILLRPEMEGEGTKVTLLTCWTWLDRTRGLRFQPEQARQRPPLLGVRAACLSLAMRRRLGDDHHVTAATEEWMPGGLNGSSSHGGTTLAPGATATGYTEGKRRRPGRLQLGLCGCLKGLSLAIALQAPHRIE